LIVSYEKNAIILSVDTAKEEKQIKIKREDNSEQDLSVNDFHHRLSWFAEFGAQAQAAGKKVNLTLWDGKIADATLVK
jgi:hypothetical protein